MVGDAVIYDAVGEVRLQQLDRIRYDVMLLMLLVKVVTVGGMSVRRRGRGRGGGGWEAMVRDGRRMLSQQRRGSKRKKRMSEIDELHRPISYDQGTCTDLSMLKRQFTSPTNDFNRIAILIQYSL